MNGFFAFLCSLGVGIYSAAVLATLWGWFVVSQFGLPPLSVPMAYGLCLTAHLLFPSNTATLAMILQRVCDGEDSSTTEARAWISPVIGFLFSTCALIFGYATRWFL